MQCRQPIYNKYSEGVSLFLNIDIDIYNKQTLDANAQSVAAVVAAQTNRCSHTSSSKQPSKQNSWNEKLILENPRWKLSVSYFSYVMFTQLAFLVVGVLTHFIFFIHKIKCKLDSSRTNLMIVISDDHVHLISEKCRNNKKQNFKLYKYK